MRLEHRLPDWSNPSLAPEAFEGIGGVAAEFVSLDDLERRITVQSYADMYCLPRFDLATASGLYIFLRVVFDLPTHQPRDDAKIFGGWLHPSIAKESQDFDLSWPVHAEDEGVMTVDEFAGYFGKGYDAIGEYEWFKCNFPMRLTEVLAATRLLPSASLRAKKSVGDCHGSGD